MANGYYEFPIEDALALAPTVGENMTRWTRALPEDVGRANDLVYLGSSRPEKAWTLEEADWFACHVLKQHPGAIWGDLYWEGPVQPPNPPENATRCAGCRRWGAFIKRAPRNGDKRGTQRAPEGYVTIRARNLCEWCYIRAADKGELSEWPSQLGNNPKLIPARVCRACETSMLSKWTWTKRGKPEGYVRHHARGYCDHCYYVHVEKVERAKAKERELQSVAV